MRDELADWGPRNLRVVPNALLPDAAVAPPPSELREQLRRTGPVRVLARLGPEKGVLDLMEGASDWDRPVEVALAEAGFEVDEGSQSELPATAKSRPDERGARSRHDPDALTPMPWH
ncbi:hypothetical protein ACIQWA_33130 [Kitasatospora sp. NPDC098652]|uniref:hypothetical protein n=1 Tax=Kitasatospora sp. NPDC098652 TaxID=3364095 RepID=UPI0038217967